ncbi:phage protein NinX family protein [Morganella morganii]|uniref:phage protein NinX family protein n=1 Tax=Morganella morganii TaxID=582 RepID=UPI003EB8EE9D
MNKYRDKSDFEINKAVAERYLPCDYRYNESDKIVELIGVDLSCEFGSSIDIEKEHVYGKFDPCNNPADAMPIIIENKITVAYDHLNGEWCAYSGSEIAAHSDNYYRAAMICFLMMKEAENEK